MKIEIRKTETDGREQVGIGLELRILAEDGTDFTDKIVMDVFDVDIGFSEWMELQEYKDIEKIAKYIYDL